MEETRKKESRSYLYDETNRIAEGTNWKGNKSAYTYNGLGLRVNNTQTTHAGKSYTRDYVLDYTSFENDDLMVFAEGNGQLEYEQKHVYAGNERIEQFTDKGNWYQYCGSNPATYWDPTGLKKTTSTKQALLAGSEIEPALFWRQRDFFQRAWYQDEETFNLAYQMLLKEAGTSNLSVISLAEMYDYFDYFGYTNTRLATLQALVGAEVTGVYYGQELSAVGSILISQGVEYNSWNPKLTQSTLKELKDWYDSCNKTVRKLSYELDNGWGDVISGVTYLSVATVANQQAKAQSVGEGGSGYKGENETVTSNKGNTYDNTPSNNHSIATGNPIKGERNASVDILDKYGNIVRRWFDSDGNVLRDLDYTNHGNPKTHAEWPHEHIWKNGRAPYGD